MTSPQNGFFESLGLQPETLTNPLKYIRIVRDGISGDVVKHAVKTLENRELFVRLLDTTSSNLSRFYKRKKIKSIHSEEMLDVIRLYGQAACTFGGLDKALEWVDTPLPVFSGEKPKALLDTFEGRNWVSQVLRKIEHGEFV